jgi:hypothetical protein
MDSDLAQSTFSEICIAGPHLRVVPLKGLDLILRDCPRANERAMGDIDVAVHPDDLERFAACMTVLGYERNRTKSFYRATLPAFSEEWVTKNGAVSVDVVSRFWYERSQDLIWKRSRVRSSPIGSIRLLDSIDAFLYLIAYGLVCRGSLSTRMVADTQMWWEKEGH